MIGQAPELEEERNKAFGVPNLAKGTRMPSDLVMGLKRHVMRTLDHTYLCK